MAHSIPDAFAVALTCELGTTLITGDYKFDQTPVDGVPADVSRLAELGREGLLLLCGDSTNADRPGMSPSESSVGPHLEEAFAPLQRAHRRDLLRVQHPPRPAGRRRRRRARTQGRARRPLDAQERQHRPLARAHRRPGRAADRHARARGLPRPQARDRLDRQPGRAALGAAADGPRRPSPGRAARRRHGDVLGDPDPGQRARRQRDDRPHLPARRRRRDHRATCRSTPPATAMRRS